MIGSKPIRKLPPAEPGLTTAQRIERELATWQQTRVIPPEPVCEWEKDQQFYLRMMHSDLPPFPVGIPLYRYFEELTHAEYAIAERIHAEIYERDLRESTWATRPKEVQ